MFTNRFQKLDYPDTAERYPPILVLPLGLSPAEAQEMMYYLRKIRLFSEYIFVMSGSCVGGRRTDLIVVLPPIQNADSRSKKQLDIWIKECLMCCLRPGGRIVNLGPYDV